MGESEELPIDCVRCYSLGSLCDYHLREELQGTRQANQDLHKRIAELEEGRPLCRCADEVRCDMRQRIAELKEENLVLQRVSFEGPQ